MKEIGGIVMNALLQSKKEQPDMIAQCAPTIHCAKNALKQSTILTK